jgi:GntR family transcriptional regulator, transcriptional repressor for pyruvate dehydrogenase complex
VGRRTLRQPRVGELVAGEMRDRILAGELDGGLPPQDALLAEFGVSVASLREGLRILETEGLISVQRGNVGGAVVHRPGPPQVAYTLGLVLQAMGVSVADVRAGLQRLEPACAGACAERTDRASAVLPHLRANLDAAAAVVADAEAEAYMRLAREFHASLVQRCGNATMIVMVGALEALWTAQVEELAFASEGVELGSFADVSVRRASLREHEALFRSIAEGKSRRAEELARAHFTEQRWTYGFGGAQVVHAAGLGPWSGRVGSGRVGSR